MNKSTVRNQVSWDDIKILIAVHRAGSTLGAAKMLSVSQPTIQRRIAALERAIKRQVVERQATGYRLTELGVQLCGCAEVMEEAMGNFHRLLQARDHGLSGLVRVTCAEPLAPTFVRPILKAFRSEHPEAQVEVLMTDRSLDLTSGEADIAIRGVDGSPGALPAALVQKKVGVVPWAVYASRDYLEERGGCESEEDLNKHAIITSDGSAFREVIGRWLEVKAPNAEITARGASILSVLASAKSGAGLALLPKGIGNLDADLVLVLEPNPPVTANIFLLMHENLKATPRFRALFDFFATESRKYKKVFLGAPHG